MPVNPPRQTRSQRTLERFLRAAAELLSEKPWPAVTVAELAAAADASVGAFYARFADKQALLDHLDERYADELVVLFRMHMEHAVAESLSPEARAQHLLQQLVRYFFRYRGMLRTLVMEARSGSSPRFAARTERMNAELPALVESFFAALPPGAATRAEVRQAMAFTFSALRDQILFPESIPAWERSGTVTPVQERTLTRALVRNFLGYLGTERAP